MKLKKKCCKKYQKGGKFCKRCPLRALAKKKARHRGEG